MTEEILKDIKTSLGLDDVDEAYSLYQSMYSS